MVELASGFIATLHGMLAGSGRHPAPKARAYGLEEIRQAMLDRMGEEGCTEFPHVERRILFASDIQGLWYLRPDVLMVISSVYGERAAQETVADLSDMFEGLLPKSLHTRRGSPAR